MDGTEGKRRALAFGATSGHALTEWPEKQKKRESFLPLSVALLDPVRILESRLDVNGPVYARTSSHSSRIQMLPSFRFARNSAGTQKSGLLGTTESPVAANSTGLPCGVCR
jgi:hypothetical protein